MIEYLNEPVTVELRYYESQKTRPLAFIWRGHRYQIESWGRESAEIRDGKAAQCYLVQTAHLETWELCQDNETAQWVLVRHWAAGHRVV
jgi:hypothetical protein